MKLDSLAIKYDNGLLWVLDQQALPQQEIWLECHSIDDMCAMIKALKVRGAPLIGIAALLALMQYVTKGATIEEIKIAIKQLVATRPTAVNLKNYMQVLLNQLTTNVEVVFEIGQKFFLEDITLCENMATLGAELIPPGANLMTCCNTGGLATAGSGTALAVIKKAFQQQKVKHVFPCETRPLLQGGRLTAWELEKANIPYTLICDNMAAMVMAVGHKRVKPSDFFIEKAQTVSNRPATIRLVQAMAALLSEWPGRPGCVAHAGECRDGGGRGLTRRDVGAIGGGFKVYRQRLTVGLAISLDAILDLRPVTLPHARP